VRALDELIDRDEPAMELIEEWMAKARRPAELLTCATEDGEANLQRLQVTTRSPMGALAYGSGGLLVDDGWVRVLGCRCARLPRGLADWNDVHGEPRLVGALLVGDDVLGGFFALNGDRFESTPGNIYYLAPDTLEWEDLGFGYSGWLTWLLSGDLDAFYAGSRWPGWRADTRALPEDVAFSIYPFLFTEGPPVGERSRRSVSIEELWSLHAVELPARLSVPPDDR
jgi:hypothetical protein